MIVDGPGMMLALVERDAADAATQLRDIVDHSSGAMFLVDMRDPARLRSKGSIVAPRRAPGAPARSCAAGRRRVFPKAQADQLVVNYRQCLEAGRTTGSTRRRDGRRHAHLAHDAGPFATRKATCGAWRASPMTGSRPCSRRPPVPRSKRRCGQRRRWRRSAGSPAASPTTSMTSSRRSSATASYWPNNSRRGAPSAPRSTPCAKPAIVPRRSCDRS